MFLRNGKARAFRRAAAIAVGMVLVAVTASITLANVSSPAITVTSTPGSLTVGASGTWAKSYVDNHYVGWAVSWGDSNTYALSNGTTTVHFASNTVSPGHGGTRQNGQSGTWTGGNHTYAAAGTYQVCVVMYDLGNTWPNTNSNRWVATGNNHNADNSMENNGAFSVGANCANVTVSVGKANQTITFGAIANRRFDQALTVAATASSGLPVTFTSGTTPVCTVSGTSVTFVATGTCTIRADQAGNASYNAAPQVSRSFTVSQGNQTITFAVITGKRFDQSPLTVSGTTSSGLPITFTSGTAPVCTVSGTVVTFVALGTCTIRANQAGNANWNAAAQVSRSFTVSKGNQTITFAAIANKTFNQTPLTIGATASSGLPVIFTSATAPVCTVSLTTVTFVATGTCTVRANQAGNTLWNAAAQVSQSFTVGKGDQTIAFTSTAPSAAIVGGATYTVTATGGASGNPVTYSIDSTASSVCSISGSVVSLVGPGTCVIDANQAGNARWNAAAQGQQSFAVKANQTIIFTSTAPSAAKLGGATYHATATSTSGLAVALTIDGSAASVCSISAGGVVSFIAAGTCVIDANQAGNGSYNAATQVQQSFTVGKTDQTITFAALPGRDYGDSSFVLAASASSTLPISYSVTGPCTLSNDTLTITGAGDCEVTASQAGDGTFGAAEAVVRSFTISKAPLTITANDQTRPFGAADPTFTATFSGWVNGDSTAGLTTQPSCTTTATSSSPVGTAPITCSGAASNNYDINYVAGTLTISALPVLTITANDQTRAFGAADPTFTYVVSPSASLTTPAVCTTTATASSVAGTYPITCSGAVLAGHDINYVAGTLTISALPVLTITANDQTRAFGAADPTFTYVVSPSASLTTPAVCTTTATASSVAGTYPITCSGAVLAGHNINYVAGTLTIASQELLGATATPTVAPTAIHSQSLLGATSAPSGNATPPATSTPSNTSGDSGTPILALLICLAFGCLAMLMVDKQRRTVRH